MCALMLVNMKGNEQYTHEKKGKVMYTQYLPKYEND